MEQVHIWIILVQDTQVMGHFEHGNEHLGFKNLGIP
jgi:hypothetical protein